MRITTRNKEDFVRLDNYDFNNNYYNVGKNIDTILLEASVLKYSLEKWMKLNDKPKRTSSQKRKAEWDTRVRDALKIISKKQIYQDYVVEGQPVSDLVVKYNLKYKLICDVLKEYDIPIRGLKEANNLDSTRAKYRATCEQKYGKGITNVSQAEEVKQLKAETFISHYGVDNIWKLPEYYNWLDNFMMENYGQKRITDGEKISEKRLKLFKENGKKAQELRLFYSDLAKRTWDRMTIEEQNSQLQKMREGRSKEAYSSQLEYKIKRILDAELIWNVHQFFMGKYSWDIFLGHKLLLEINGDFWHANPKIYKAEDILNYPNGEVTAKSLWQRDRIKYQYAIDRGFQVIYLWEQEINTFSDRELLQIIKEKINENKEYRKD